MDNTWRDLALQFDAHRMQAIQLLKLARDSGLANRKQIDEFLAAPPISGEKVLADRLDAIAQKESKR